MELYLNSATDYSITDDKGNRYTVDEACDLLDQIVKEGTPFDCNLAFQRLVASNFDLKAVKKYHKENP